MTSSPRIAKLEDQIQVIVAQTLQTRVKDPRLGFVTVTDVRLTGDAREATVFYTVMGDQSDLAATAAALESAKGLMRSTVGKRLGLRFAPTLAFVPDATTEAAADMEELLARVRQADEELESRKGTEFAGSPEPYRADDEDE
ncbi:30S ribosome-binding factor RbfA [Propionibacterium australiense]|uniref:Ribosome-binding factor A n=1 Tax=Propionibacterium australiense TaxID=119981 RepID=A0A383S839_9ACTN|nr:30S ribosome-binding factor RbfA [Propionibacterium australiense]RLP12398.1 30S ribosome-binding factor RbfA [Propionibacterium australiense]SYZ34003.1 K homology domain-like, alpha/beta [Propionibacterium australiense]VEH91334.1 Ribosome-binding factor A [Propionibacterium australiense]